MFLQKSIIALALTSIISPLGLQASNATNQAMQASHSNLVSVPKAGPDILQPFNPDTFVHEYYSEDSYYAYYDHPAFPFVFGGKTYGYTLKMGYGSMIYLIGSYKWGVEHGINPYGAILSYVIGGDMYQTPFTAGWPLWGHFQDDATENQEASIYYAFDMFGASINAIDFIQQAKDLNTTVTFYFYSQIVSDVRRPFVRLHYAKIMIANNWSRATITTPWYPGTP